MIHNSRAKKLSSKASTGIKASDCLVVPGGFVANIEHFEGLLQKAGVDLASIKKGNSIERLTALRLEVHNRGILPIAGRTAAAAPVVTAVADQEVPAEFVRQVTQITSDIEELRAALSTGAVATAAPNVSTLRAEIKSLANKLDAASISRKMELLATVRKIEAGTYDAGAPAKITSLLAELATLTGKMDNVSTTRKTQICRDLRQLREAA